jgi:kumamolisin
MAAATKFASQTRVVLPGSEKAPFTASAAPPHATAPKASTGKITVTVVVRRKAPIATKNLGKPGATMTRAAFLKAHGPAPSSLKLLKSFAKEFGLTIEDNSPGGNKIHLSGSSAAMQKAFGVTLSQQQVDGGSYRVREGAICLPESLTGHIEAVLGLDNRPQAKPHFRGVATPHANNVAYTPVQVAELYGFPTTGAKGQTIGIIELGGGYKPADITAYFKSLGIPAPTVTAVLVDKAKNAPTNANSADGEVLLDIEVCAAVAPGAKIAVYFAPNTDQGFVDAITTAVHDKTNKPSVISISWGGPESTWTAQAMTALDSACQAAAALGVTITVAAGDDGSTDGVSGTASHVDFPASSPHVLACGGTKLIGSGSTITSEVVWNELAANEGATGGGVSAVFPLPSWQSAAGVPKPTGKTGGRGVPDVSGDADPTTGYTIRVDGQTFPIGGTSAVAPLWAGLISLSNAASGVSAGFVNPTLYAGKSKGAFRDITSGNNGAFSAGPGWDACTGLGSPNGAGLVKALAPAKKAAKKVSDA